MEARHIAYVVYFILISINAVALATADVRVTNWQFWVTSLCIIGAYICGIFRGVVK